MKKAILLGLAMILLAAIMTYGNASAYMTDSASILYTKETSIAATSTKPTTTTTKSTTTRPDNTDETDPTTRPTATTANTTTTTKPTTTEAAADGFLVIRKTIDASPSSDFSFEVYDSYGRLVDVRWRYENSNQTFVLTLAKGFYSVYEVSTPSANPRQVEIRAGMPTMLSWEIYTQKPPQTTTTATYTKETTMASTTVGFTGKPFA